MSNKSSFATGFLAGAAIPSLIIGIIGIAAIVGGVIYYRSTLSSQSSNSGGTSKTNSGNTSNAKANALGAEPAWAKGSANAVVTLEEFADFECASCARFEPTMREIRTIYGDRVRVIFRQFPLVQIHQKAYDASRATEAAGLQGKFWEMHDLIYDKQTEWVKIPEHRREFGEYARQLGLDVTKFENDMINNPQVNERVAADLKRGGSLGVSGTPSVFFNGRKLEYPTEMTTDRMRQMIDQALQKK